VFAAQSPHGLKVPLPRTMFCSRKLDQADRPARMQAVVEMPISAPGELAAIANCVLALCMTMALSTSARETLRGGPSLLCDRFGVLAAPARDVTDRAVARPPPRRDDRRQVFRAPVLVGGGERLASRSCTSASPRTSQPSSCSLASTGIRWVSARPIDSKVSAAAAHAHPAHLGVATISRAMATSASDRHRRGNAVIVAQHRHAAFLGDAVDQRAPAARPRSVGQRWRAKARRRRRVGGGHELNAILGQPGGRERGPQQLDDGARGVEAVGAAAQDTVCPT